MSRRAAIRVQEALASGQDPERLEGLAPRELIQALLALLCSTDEALKWRAVAALGLAGARLAEADLESGRDLLRRLAWTLNDESGGIGWGAAEAMAEIMAHHGVLAREFGHLLISLVTPEGFFLEHPPLLRGAVWGIGRLARERPELMKDAVPRLAALLGAEDGAVRGLAAWALEPLADPSVRQSVWPGLEKLQGDTAELLLYDQGGLMKITAGELAGRALAALALAEGGR